MSFCVCESKKNLSERGREGGMNWGEKEEEREWKEVVLRNLELCLEGTWRKEVDLCCCDGSLNWSERGLTRTCSLDVFGPKDAVYKDFQDNYRQWKTFLRLFNFVRCQKFLEVLCFPSQSPLRTGYNSYPLVCSTRFNVFPPICNLPRTISTSYNLKKEN